MWCKTASALRFEGTRLLGPSLPTRSLLTRTFQEAVPALSPPVPALNPVRTASKASAKLEKNSSSNSLTPSKRKLRKTGKVDQVDKNPLRKEQWFVALMLPAELTERVNCVSKDLSERYNTQVSTAAPHITLIPPFHATKAQLTHLKTDLREFSAAQAPVQVTLQGFQAFPKRVLYVNVTSPGEIGPLKSSLDDALPRSRHFLPASRGGFVPHVSVASKKVQKNAFDAAWGELQNKEFEGAWLATELTLLLFENNRQWAESDRFPLEAGTLAE